MKCPYCDGFGEVTAEMIGLGGIILAARKKAGITQGQLAEMVGISRTQITAIEGGRSGVPIESLRAYAKALNISPLDLIP